MNFETASMKELVRFYNENRPEGSMPAKRFSSLAAGVRRCSALIDPAPVVTEQDHLTDDDLHEFGDPIPVRRKINNNDGIAASWDDEDVRARRSQRSACKVDGKDYPSVRKAYIALGLDLKDHISFRMLLKEQGTIKIDGRKWVNVPLNY